MAGLALAAIPLLPQVLRSLPGREVEFVAGPAIGVCLACVVLSRLVRGAGRRLGLQEVWAAVPGFLAGWLVVASSLSFLALTATGGTLSATLVTVAWAGYGIALLVAGLTLADTPMRLTSLAIFAFAVGRVFLVDLANANLIVKAVAATGVGVVLILAGVGYGVFRRRMQEPQVHDANPESPADPPRQA